jgi:hypothetical protein
MIKKFLLAFIFVISTGIPVFSQYDHDLWLPDTIFLALGNTIELYNDNIAYIKLNDTSLRFEWTYLKGSSDGSKFFWTANQLGNIRLTVKCFQNDVLTDSATTIMKVVNKATSSARNLLAIGNSLTESGYNYMFPQILSDVYFPLTAIGTLGTTYKNEGRGGWMFSTFLGTTSPFWIQNSVSIQKYIQNNSLANPDIFRVSLGINECYLTYPMDDIVTNATTLIDKINSDYPNSLIIISLPTLCEKTGSGWIANYGNLSNFEPYILRMRELWKRLHAKFAYGKYKENIQISSDCLEINRTTGYPITNGLHPNSTGYKQLIRGFSNTLNYYSGSKSISTGIETIKEENPFEIFPNPVKDHFEITFSDIFPKILYLYNDSGQLVLSKKFEGNKITINTNELARGIYVCSLKIGNKYYNQKIFKV